MRQRIHTREDYRQENNLASVPEE